MENLGLKWGYAEMQPYKLVILTLPYSLSLFLTVMYVLKHSFWDLKSSIESTCFPSLAHTKLKHIVFDKLYYLCSSLQEEHFAFVEWRRGNFIIFLHFKLSDSILLAWLEHLPLTRVSIILLMCEMLLLTINKIWRIYISGFY